MSVFEATTGWDLVERLNMLSQEKNRRQYSVFAFPEDGGEPLPSLPVAVNKIQASGGVIEQVITICAKRWLVLYRADQDMFPSQELEHIY